MRYTIADLVRVAQALDDVERLRADVAEFVGEPDGTVDFFDVRTGDAFNIQPEQAMAYFRSKGLRKSFSYADALGEANDAAFTVAKMMDVDMLSMVRSSLDSALANGVSFGQWRKELTPILQAAGWWGKATITDPATGASERAQLGSAWRLETIFRTNMQGAYASGQWRQIEEQADVAPFLMYDAVDDFRTRPLHNSWDGKVLPVTSAWWRTHYPPNGYNCRCGVIQLDQQQMRDLGVSPLAEPPDDGTYQWTNPRTGDARDVPNGVDPGFDRPPVGYTAVVRELLRERVQALPDTLRDAAAKAVRAEFDASTTAGRWHKASFDKSPDWIKNAVMDRQAVEVQTRSKDGAFARAGSMIDMDGHTEAKASSQNMWRHEFGHIMDARLGADVRKSYRSSHDDFVEAQKADGDALAAAAGNGRKSKANTAKREAIVNAYEAVRNRVIDADRDARPDVLRELAAAADLDFDKFRALVRESTLVLDLGDDLRDVGVAVRVGKMIEAVRLGDGEGFVRWATFKDSGEEFTKAGTYDKGAAQTTSQSWRKDGSLGSLSDLIGSATKNKAANYHDGFSGHSNAYYRKSKHYAPTESFANLTSLAGHQNEYWFELVQRFAPNMAGLFRKIIEG